ncbi:hypothetical protein GCM10009122_29840 [Fulvivirga kasyanovii]|uniref:Uncharacterized protein n=1 Tax=Fulvivirga kasyanovii TaxID=396812 RepID=A0ABW9RLA6_9BACT|nr:hypothetical protein [Fulvivirga kasyanovii]MTI24793.1 hypothetical protein [Fulvivirga kasyanovii]
MPLPEDTYANKGIPELLDVEIKKALSYYPELQNTRIDFVFRDNIRNAVMQAQPRVKTLFKRKYKRIYKVKISRYLTLNDSTMGIEHVPHEILVGWIAHELGHIMDYIDRSSFQMIGFGFKYLTSRHFLMQAERQADTYAIMHGLADEIVKTKKFILNREDLPKEYKDRINRLYISPEEVRHIEEEMESI